MKLDGMEKAHKALVDIATHQAAPNAEFTGTETPGICLVVPFVHWASA